MSSVKHPVGPEREQTYWWRRGLVIGSAVLLVGLVIALVVGGNSTGSAVSAQPSPPPLTVPAPATPTDAPWSTPSATPSETPTASPSATDSTSPSTSAGASASASASPSESASERASGEATAKAFPKASPKASAKPSAKPTKAAPVFCSPKDLRTTLTGKQQLRPKQATTFSLSLINGSAETCLVEVTPENFELRIYSGTDRIWSSDDCSTAVEADITKLKPEDAATWSMRWDGRRSREGCKTRPEIPRPGTYFATAKLDGAKPVQLRMILRG